MMSVEDPPRSLDDPALPAAWRSALAAGRADRASPEMLARLAERLDCASSVATPIADALAIAPRARTRLARWMLTGLGALCLIGFTLAMRQSAVPVRSSAHTAATPAPVAAPAPAPVPAPAPAAVAAQPSEVRVSPRPARDVLTPRVLPAQGDAAAELALLQRAQAALEPAPSHALELAEQHAQRFPHGVFQEERELIAIVALLNRGDLGAATERSERFRRAYPGSVHRPRLEALLHAKKSAPNADPAHKISAPRAPTSQSTTRSVR